MGKWVEGLGCGGGGDGGGGGGGDPADGCMLSCRHRVVERRGWGCVRRSSVRPLPGAHRPTPLQPLMAPTLLSSTPAATEAEVKNRGSLVTSHVKASCVLRGDTRWKQTICARLYDPDVCVFPLVISPFWSDTVTDLRCLQLSFALKLT